MADEKGESSTATVDPHEPPKSNSTTSKSKLPKRFYFQPLCGIFIPLAFAAYYLWTYFVWLRPSSNPSANINKPLPNGKYIWWSWFIIGAIGLNISDYTLGGVEAAMMMTRQFTLGELKMHRDVRWSTLRAWKTVAGRLVFWWRENPGELSRLWIILFGLSVLSWSFVLSGLTMQTQDGYKAGNVPGTKLTGVNQYSMGVRENSEIINAATQLWGLDSAPTIPLGAALYVPRNSSFMANVSKPNTLPSNAMEVFLTAQAPVPITGSIWGLVMKYNCSEVHSLDEFSILSRRINSSNPAYVQSSVYEATDIGYFYTLDDGSSITVLSQLKQRPINVIGFAEVGTSTGMGSILAKTPLGYTGTNSGLDQEEVFELALWQTFWNVPGTWGNYTNVQDPISELEDQHDEPNNPFGPQDPWNGNMSAIGIRCTSSSVTGTATVNGLAGTYTDFERQDPNVTYIPTLSLGVPLMFLQTNQPNETNFLDFGVWDPLPPIGNYSVDYTVLSTNYDWIQPLFIAAQEEINLEDSDVNSPLYNSLIQTPQLRDAFIAAYQQYAIQLMFYDTAGLPLENSNVTAAIPWTLLQAGGGVPPLLVVITMLIWAVGCAGLCLVYGFRVRWAESFDDEYLYYLIDKSDHEEWKELGLRILKKV
ncbi:hypothetical protein L207DRAFT_641186 [Hyaloscypha variabilis F]|uniref:Uncharacterized protein n=1 Tax=Hyaloscypha variabilis (strain UAMH 11265 / GT02V1 / F) TaxID=1149755 RepID=A0A2J6QXQ3_HYAVF|nr:hypothetical protein L207DRAFT_641186 [Hyaloscypha variabilis F]